MEILPTLALMLFTTTISGALSLRPRLPAVFGELMAGLRFTAASKRES